jgi:inorganic pyrophosphatase
MHLVRIILVLFCLSAPLIPQTVPHAPELTPKNKYTLASNIHLVRDIRPRAGAGLLNMVVEIPAGTCAQWKVDSESGNLKWGMKNNEPRAVKYLGYPGNYGMIPRTLLPKDKGGDGNPLDVIALGPALPRGSIVKVRPVGIIKMKDRGEQDDKIIAVQPGTAMGKVRDLEELNKKFPGVVEIIKLWFSNYKAAARVEGTEIASEAEALKIINAAAAAFK